MQGRVDVQASVVRVGDQRWPFDLDLSAGAASLEIENLHYALRPLLWREKVTLARFAHLGLPFVQHHFLRLSLAGKLPPTNEAARAALNALALWLNAPDESQPGIPLDSELLGSVALKVCRAAGLRPADLDERPASDVELLWQAIAYNEQPATNLPPEANEGQVRILIVPDPLTERPLGMSGTEHDAQSQAPSAELASDATQENGDFSQQPTGSRSSSEAGYPEAKAMPNQGIDLEPSGASSTAANREREASFVSNTSTLPMTLISPATASLPKPRAATPIEKPVSRTASANAFRIFYPTAIVQNKPDDNEPILSDTPQQPTDNMPTPFNRTRASTGTIPIAFRSSSTSATGTVTATPSSNPVTVSAMPSLSQPTQALQQASPPIEWDILLDELNERLEQAADDLGIDLEG